VVTDLQTCLSLEVLDALELVVWVALEVDVLIGGEAAEAGLSGVADWLLVWAKAGSARAEAPRAAMMTRLRMEASFSHGR
jgi:hypothetical protein